MATRDSEIGKRFLEQGYVIVPADQMAPLEMLRSQIFETACEVFEHRGSDAETFFNNFHRLDITGTRLNELRMKLIQHCNQHIDSGTLIFEAFRDTLLGLLGPDLLVQKNTNLVIQQPQDPNPSEVHRDAPANSAFEIVIWLPLVDCFRSKCLYVCNRIKTEAGLKLLDSLGTDWSKFEQYCLDEGDEPDVPFGSALLFWPGLFHGSRINSEEETRWTLNMRYKNVFSPNGLKEPFEFFKILQLSPLAQLGIDFQKREIFK